MGGFRQSKSKALMTMRTDSSDLLFEKEDVYFYEKK